MKEEQLKCICTKHVLHHHTSCRGEENIKKKTTVHLVVKQQKAVENRLVIEAKNGGKKNVSGTADKGEVGAASEANSSSICRTSYTILPGSSRPRSAPEIAPSTCPVTSMGFRC